VVVGCFADVLLVVDFFVVVFAFFAIAGFFAVDEAIAVDFCFGFDAGFVVFGLVGAAVADFPLTGGAFSRGASGAVSCGAVS
jgi:hypothetical protein